MMCDFFPHVFITVIGLLMGDMIVLGFVFVSCE